jgi:hypothetical protein
MTFDESMLLPAAVQKISRHTYVYHDMLRHMRTTVRLDEALLERAKREARRRHTTLTALLEEGLQLALARGRRSAPRAHVSIPVSNTSGGTLPGVELNDSAALLDILEGRQ